MSSSARIALLLLLLSASCGKSPPAGKWPSETTDARILEARRLMTEAGYEFGRGLPKLSVLYNEGAEYHKSIAAAFQEMWRKNLGLNVELVNKEWKVYLEDLQKGAFDIGRRAYTGEYADPQVLLSLFRSDSFFNTTGWSSKRFDELLDKSNLEPDPVRRMAVLAEAERLLLDEAPFIPVYHYIGHNLIKPFIQGVHPNSRDLHPLQHVSLEGPGKPADGVLIFNAGSEPYSIDPALSKDIAGLKILMHLLEGLVVYDPVDAHPVPGMAERWEISQDGRVYTFHLREAAWSNGDPVTAADFVYAWRRVVDPATNSDYAHRMYEVKNAKAINLSGADPATLGIRAIDARTLEVTLEQRTPYFLQLICLNLYMPVHRPTVEKHKAGWVQPEHFVGNGPYRMTSWKINDRKSFEKNPAYHAAARVKLEKFIFLAVEKSETAFRLYENGQCHWLFTVPPSRVPELKQRSDYLINPYNGTYFYVFNVNRRPLDDVRVRKALTLAVDVKTIVSSILFGVEPPAERLTPPLYPGYEVK